jgi:hypothetical protein
VLTDRPADRRGGHRAQGRHVRPIQCDSRRELRSPADGAVTGDDDLDVVGHALEQLERAEIVLERIRGLEIEEGHQDVGEHVSGDEHAGFHDQQRRVARGVRPMLDDPHFGTIPGNALGAGGEPRDESEQLHRDLVGVLRRQPLGDAGLPVGVREQFAHRGRAASRAVARRVAEVGVPEHVVPIGMRREARDDALARFAKIVREGGHLVARDPRVDQQHTGLARHDDGVALEEFALVDEHALSDLSQHGRTLRPGRGRSGPAHGPVGDVRHA